MFIVIPPGTFKEKPSDETAVTWTRSQFCFSFLHHLLRENPQKTLKVPKNGKRKTCNSFCSLKRDVARFTTHRDIKTCLATNQVVAESREYFYRVRHDSSVILSNQKSVFTQLAATFSGCKTGLHVVGKRATSLYNRFSSNAAKQVARFCCSFYHSLSGALMESYRKGYS